MAKTILFLVNNNDACLDAMEPVVNVIKKNQKDISCVALGIAEYFSSPVTDEKKLKEIFDDYTILKHELKKIPDIETESRFAEQYQNISQKDYTDDIAKSEPFIEEFLKVNNISAIVMVNDRFFPEWHIVQIANEMNIPSLLIQESVRKDEGFQEYKTFHGQGGCTKIAAWGENGVEYFNRVGATGELIVTGSPRLDKFYNQCKSQDKASLRKELGVPENANVVLFASNNLFYMQMVSAEEYCHAIAIIADENNVCRANDNTYLLVKPHRNERRFFKMTGYDNYLKEMKNVIYCPDIELSTAVVASDSVVLFNSTVAVESAILGKRVGVVNFHNWDLYADFIEKGIAQKIENINQYVEFLVLPPLREEEQEKIIENSQYYITHLGYSAEKVADCVLSML
jgi:hypothetical protein